MSVDVITNVRQTETCVLGGVGVERDRECAFVCVFVLVHML